MKEKIKPAGPHTLFFSPPGGYPGVANLGLEIVVDAVARGTDIPCETFRSDFFLCRWVHPDLLNKAANLDAMDFFYADAVFPRLSSEKLSAKRDAYLQANGFTAAEKNRIAKALGKLEHYFRQYLKRTKPKALAVSLNSERLITALFYIDMARRIVPGIRIIAGGSALQGEVGKSVFACFKQIDYLATGRGEEVAQELIARLYHGEETRSVAGGLLSRENGFTLEHRDIPSRKPYPLPEMDDYYEELVRLTALHGREAFGHMYGIAVIQSAGCWWGKCDFCSEPDDRRGYALADADRVADYIRQTAMRHHLSDIFFLDSIQPPAPYLKKLMGHLNSHAIPYRMSGEIHAGIDDETLDLLLATGFKTLQIGIESYAQNLLGRMNKGVTVMDLLRILTRCADRSVAVYGNLLMHHPLETPEDVRETIRVADLTTHLFVPFLQHYFAALGSPLWTRLQSRKVRTYPLMRHALLYPRNLLRRLVFSYRYAPEHQSTYALWRTFVRRREQHRPAERKMLSYIDGGNTMHVMDTRRAGRKSFYLDRRDRDLVLACARPQTLSSLEKMFPGQEADQMAEALERLVHARVMFEQNNRYLTLATPWKNPGRESL